MAEDHIRVTCPSCNHVIKAPRAAAGRRGKCPHCHASVYVPTPPDDLEEIPLAADYDADLEREKELEQETRRLASQLDHEREEASPEPAQTVSKTPSTPRAQPAQATTNINDAIVAYLLALKSSDLQKAEQMIQQLKASAHQAKSKVQQLMVDAMPPPPLADFPEGLYQGFLKKLQGELDSEAA